MKKKITIILMLVISLISGYTQTPEVFNYQAIARGTTGNIITNQQLAFQISILQGGPTGTTVYSEIHNPTTNDYGLVNLEIGNGIATIGDFTTIDWSLGNYFLQIELDENNGTNYQLMGTSQLLAVPYAFYAETAGNSDDGDWIASGNNLYNSNTGNVGIGTSNPDGKFVVMDGADTLLKVIDGQIRIPGNGPTQGIAFMGDEKGGGGKSLNIRNGLLRPAPDTQALATGGLERLRITANGDIGIGTISPLERLDVQGGLRVGYTSSNNAGAIRWTGGQMEYNNGSQWLPFASGIGSQWSENGSAIFYNNGKVGIGTSSPGGLLSLAGNDPYLTFDASASSDEMGLKFSHDGIVKYSWDFDNATNNIILNWDQDDLGFGDILFKRFGDDRLAIRNNGDILFKRFGDDRLAIRGDGNVGIGTATPTKRFTIQGDETDVRLDLNSASPSNIQSVQFAVDDMEQSSISYDKSTNDLVFNFDAEDLGTGDILFKRYGDERLAIRNNGDILFRRWGDDRLAIRGDGNVGIGTATPTKRFTIQGNETDVRLDLNSTSPSNIQSVQFAVDGLEQSSISYDKSTNDLVFNFDAEDLGTGDILFKRFGDDRLAIRNNGDILFKRWGDDRLAIRGDGNVGIGTSTPAYSLDIRGSNPDEGGVLQLGNSDESNFLRFFGGRIGDPEPYIWWQDGTPLRFVSSAGGFTEHLRIDAFGNVGIGTPSPTHKLDINGEARIQILSMENGLNNVLVADPQGVLHVRDAATLGGGGASLWMESGPDIHNINPGNVGIGTPMPTHTLDVLGEARIEIMTMNNSLNNVVVADEFGVLHIRDAFTLGGFGENIKVDENGNLGIGTDKPTAKAHIKDVLRLEPRVTFPPTPEEGDIFVNANDHNIYCFLNGMWKPLND
ncbi:MAG: hypothetical protein K9G76_06305 [Bacteroidales bacterium]|nr:hypothetical protein [Bacteroidales bacterium]MCF8402359.1 hypothetical protein [Bacteroidales bacterium]